MPALQEREPEKAGPAKVPKLVTQKSVLKKASRQGVEDCFQVFPWAAETALKEQQDCLVQPVAVVLEQPGPTVQPYALLMERVKPVLPGPEVE